MIPLAVIEEVIDRRLRENRPTRPSTIAVAAKPKMTTNRLTPRKASPAVNTSTPVER